MMNSVPLKCMVNIVILHSFYPFMIVFNEQDNHSFCHHEILITAYPLALEWLDFDPGEPDEKGKWDMLYITGKLLEPIIMPNLGYDGIIYYAGFGLLDFPLCLKTSSFIYRRIYF